jgi:hypothetical protein
MVWETHVMDKKKTQDNTGSARAGKKKQYEKPRLVCYGDVRTMTLAPTPGGNAESGNDFSNWTGGAPSGGG